MVSPTREVRNLLEKTESLCPECLKVIPARRALGEDVYLEKECPEHGKFRTLIWRDAELYQKWGYGEEALGPQKAFTEVARGCPYDCGLCPNHKAETCTVVMEVTQRCDLNCPICFASSKRNQNDSEPEEIREMYQTILNAGGPFPVQLSGGEPTVRDDLPNIIATGKKMGFNHIQINTHGLRLAKDKEYLRNLKESGVDLIYLQFDGLSNQIYRRLRGANLLELKLKAIANCAAAEIGVLLVPTLVPGINDHQMGDIIRFAKKWIPFVKGVHFQPITYIGRYPRPPEDKDRITIPDVLKALESQTEGEVKVKNFVPRRRKDSHCGFSGFFILMEDGKLLATTDFELQQSIAVSQGHRESPSEHVRRVISQQARFVGEEPNHKAEQGTWQSFFQRAKTHFLSISGMPFQDAWTIDLERLQGCCIHVVTPDKELVPFCAFYLTNIKGERLYRNRKYLKIPAGFSAKRS